MLNCDRLIRTKETLFRFLYLVSHVPNYCSCMMSRRSLLSVSGDSNYMGFRFQALFSVSSQVTEGKGYEFSCL